MRFSVLVVVSVALLGTAYGQSTEEDSSSVDVAPRLNAGNSFTRQNFDSIVYIALNNNKSTIQGCTGVLISNRHVLTQNACLTVDPVTNTPNFQKMVVTIAKTSSSNKKTSYKFSVVEVFGSDQLVSSQATSDLAILTLSKAVSSSIALPAKLYGGDYKISTPAMLIGMSTSATGNATVSLDKMRFENLNIASTSYCLGANAGYDQVGELCSLVKSGLNTCKGDFGAPVFTPVDNNGTIVIGSGSGGLVGTDWAGSAESKGPGSKDEVDAPITSAKPATAKAYALLALTSDSITSANQVPGATCAQTGSTGYYSWVYPFIDQIAAIVQQSTKNMTLTNHTLSSTNDPFLHPGIVTAPTGGVAKIVPLSAAALLGLAAAALF
ncbi:hypothetical protein IWW38_000782 [Coemansia aciculifera]|uniref:Uncharacterized protein n=1 Tax=Coemansia aciculifera TaxID=417176 RepID=A0ACC1M865_9FUNG|nr:hypothetical protein IWW38_000782 [Coemansia aciculifera]